MRERSSQDVACGENVKTKESAQCCVRALPIMTFEATRLDLSCTGCLKEGWKGFKLKKGSFAFWIRISTRIINFKAEKNLTGYWKRTGKILYPPYPDTQCLWKFGVQRIMEQYRLEGTLQGHTVDLPRGTSTGPSAQRPEQPDLERCQGWLIHPLCGQHIPGVQHPNSQKLLPHM